MIARFVTLLPQPGFADEAERLARLEVERHAVDGVDRPLVGPEADDEVLDREQGRSWAAPAGAAPGARHRLIRGSSDSRRPSPRRLNPIALIEIAAPGKKISHGAWR